MFTVPYLHSQVQWGKCGHYVTSETAQVMLSFWGQNTCKFEIIILVNTLGHPNSPAQKVLEMKQQYD